MAEYQHEPWADITNRPGAGKIQSTKMINAGGRDKPSAINHISF